MVKQLRRGVNMSVFSKTLYHGSDKKLKTLVPMGINMGMRFSSPKWSTYFWATEKQATYWAIYQTCRRNTGIKTLYHIKTGKFIVMDKDYNKLMEKAVGLKCYVYTCEIPMMSLGLGSSPDIEEYTYDKTLVPKKIKEIKINNTLLKQSVIMMTPEEFDVYKEEVKAGKHSGGRGILYKLIMDYNKDIKRHNYKHLKPGDPIN
jgi:hypothetical protein